MRWIPLVVLLGVILLSAGCMKEAPETGSLEVTSTPAGREVQVVLDGNYRGVTPLLLTNLSAGYHLLQLKSPGYADKVIELTLTAGERTHFSADYPPQPTPTPVTPAPLPTPEPETPTATSTTFPQTPLPSGGLYITSFPSGATIYLDGKGYGTTPRLIQNLTPRSYELRLSLVGWEDYRIILSVSPGVISTEAATLRT
jgi:hypothetical protein